MNSRVRMIVRNLKVLILGVAVLASGAVLQTPAYAQKPSGAAKLLWLAEVNSKQAAKLVEKKTGGKVLSVIETDRKGEAGYQVKVLLPEGRIRKLFVNKNSGAVSG